MTTKNTENYKLKGKIGKYSPRPKVTRKQRAKVLLSRGAKRLGSGLKVGTVKVARASGRGLKKAGQITGRELKKEFKRQTKAPRRAVRRSEFKQPKSEFESFGNVGMNLGFNDPWGPKKKKKRKSKSKGITIKIG